jgi:hypothetical protein
MGNKKRERVEMVVLTETRAAQRKLCAALRARGVKARPITVVSAARVPKVTKRAERAALAACRALGSPATPRFVAIAAEQLDRLLRGGVTVGEALAVARYARRRYDGGDRFLPLLNLTYVWSDRAFPSLVAAMRPARRRAA